MLNYFFQNGICIVVVFLFFGVLVGCNRTTLDNTLNTTNSVVDIQHFKTNPSDQFLVNYTDVIDGHMFKGANSLSPHSGAHVVFSTHNGPVQELSYYPPIYAVADGQVSRVETYFQVNPSNSESHFRYGLSLIIAKQGDLDVVFHYSIEPFIDPLDSSFYLPFIQVKKGDNVKKGDIVAYMFQGSNQNLHIHFHLKVGDLFQAPVIFSKSVMTQFLERISTKNGGGKNYVLYDQGVPTEWMGDCLGYKITANENPFESEPAECLNYFE